MVGFQFLVVSCDFLWFRVLVGGSLLFFVFFFCLPIMFGGFLFFFSGPGPGLMVWKTQKQEANKSTGTFIGKPWFGIAGTTANGHFFGIGFYTTNFHFQT